MKKNWRKVRRNLVGGGVGAAAMLAAIGGAHAQAEARCVRVLGYSWGGDSQSLDPAAHNNNDDSIGLNAVYNRLVNLDSNFQLVPELAESWEPSNDGKVWDFKLRRGVTFHDGSPFGAKDVKYSLTRLLDPGLPTSAKDVLLFLKEENVEVVDDHTIRFSFDTPYAEFPLLMAHKYNYIVPDGATPDTLRTKGIGTGPFKAVDFVPGNPVRRFTRNENYWRKDLPKADCLIVTASLEPVQSLGQIKAGAVDLSLQVTPAMIPALEGDNSVQLLPTAASTSITISMFVDTPPFDDARVREAMKLVVDRDLVVKTVFAGFGEVGADSPIPVSAPDSFVAEAPAQDIARAKQLLAEAGHASGLDVTLYTSEALPGMTQWAQLYAQFAAAAGINVTINKTPADSYWDDVWLKQPLVTSGWNRRPTGESLSYSYVSSSTQNETHFKNEEYDTLLKEAAQTIDDGERRAIYQKAQRLLAKEGGMIIPGFVHQVAAMRSNCEGYQPHVQAFVLNFENLECK